MRTMTPEERRERLIALGKRHTSREVTQPASKALPTLESDKLGVLLKEICGALEPVAEARVGVTHKTLVSAMLSVLRPLIAQTLDPTRHTTVDKYDGRQKTWNVHLYLFEREPQWEYSESSLTADDAEELEAGGYNLCKDMEGTYFVELPEVRGLLTVGEETTKVLSLLHDIDMAHTFAPFNTVAMSKRMAGMHPAISRGGGEAQTIISYENEGCAFKCRVEIKRT